MQTYMVDLIPANENDDAQPAIFVLSDPSMKGTNKSLEQQRVPGRSNSDPALASITDN